MPYGTTFFVLRLRLCMLQWPRSDPKQRRSDDHWHEKQTLQPYTPHAPPCCRATTPLVATHQHSPSISPRQWDRITVYPSRSMSWMFATIVSKHTHVAGAKRRPRPCSGGGVDSQ